MNASNGSLFSQLNYSASSNADDLLLVSVKDGTSYVSKTILLSSLACQINKDLEEELDFGSAAYYDQSEYAALCHDHDIFTSAEYIQTLEEPNMFNVLSIKHQSSDNADSVMKISVVVPHIDSSIAQEWKQLISDAQPKIGTMTFIAANDPAVISDTTMSDFIGWVPANGKTYELTDFILSDDLYLLYGTSQSEFKVPDLNSFCKMNNGLTNKSEWFDGHDVVPKHSHPASYENATIDILNLTTNNITPISIGLSTYYNNAPDKKDNIVNKMHGGKKYSAKDNGIKSFSLTATNDIDSSTFANTMFTTLDDGDVNASDCSGENYWKKGAYPAYNLLPVFIYVGRSRHSADLVSF